MSAALLAGKIAVVTGAGAGLGAAIARAVAAQGARVVVSDIDPDTAKNTAAGIEGAAAIPADVTDEGRMKHTVPALIERGGGSIINASSVAGLRGVAGHTLYGASKGAVRIMTKDVAAEYASANIRVNSIHPTYTKTAMADYGAAAAGATLDELAEKMVPLGRLAEVDDVAKVVVFLASDDAAYLTGGEYVIDGGGMNMITL